MKRLLCAVLMSCVYASAQQINPKQIQPSTTNGQVIETVGGVAQWANGGGGGGCGSGSDCVVTDPTGTQTIVQPASSYFNVNNYNAVYQADQFGSTNGISTVTGLPTACIVQNATGPSGCIVSVSPNYANTEFPQGYEMPTFPLRNFLWPSGTLVEDHRNGVIQIAAENPMSNTPESGVALQVLTGVTRNWLQQQPFPNAPIPGTQDNQFVVFGGGTNYFRYPTGSPAYEYKPYYVNITAAALNYSSGQTFGIQNTVSCHGLGDCIGDVTRILADGGENTGDDEPIHLADSSVLQNPDVYTGTITGTVTTGSTSIGTTATIGDGTEGQDRLLVCTGCTGTLTGPSFTNPTTRQFVGPLTPTALLPYTATDSTASYPVSTMILGCYPGSDNGAGGASACASGTQPSGFIPPQNTSATGLSPAASVVIDVVAPFTATGGFSGIPSGFCTASNLQSSSSGSACYMPATGVATIDDSNSEYETVNYTYNSVSQQITLLNLRFPHNNGFIVSYGGLSQASVASDADNYVGAGFFGFNGQVFPVIGSVSSTTIYYDTQNNVGPLGVSQDQAGSSPNGGLCFSTPAASFTLQSDNHTVLFNMTAPSGTNNPFPLYNGLTLTINTGNATYNGSFVVQWGTAGNQQFTYFLPSTPTGGAPSSGTVSFCNTSYHIWPSARVVSVLNPSNSKVDGLLTVMPNSIPWTTGANMFEAQYFNMSLTGTGGADLVTQVSPRNYTGTPLNGQSYQGLVSGAGFTLFEQQNGTADSEYLGYGGTHTAPPAIYGALGHSAYTLTLDSPEESILKMNGCKAAPIGCSNANSNVDILEGPVLPNGVPGQNQIDLINYDSAFQAANRGQGLFSGRYFFGNIAGAGQGNLGQSFATVEGGYIVGDQSITAPTISANNLFTTQISTINNAPGATCTGSCSTPYQYYWVGHAQGGGTTLPVTVGVIDNAASLSSSNFNLICVFHNPGYASYDLLRGDTAHSITLGLSATSPNGASFGTVANYSCVKDTGLSTTAYSTPGSNTTGGAEIAGPLEASIVTIDDLIGNDGCLESVSGMVTSTGTACGSGGGGGLPNVTPESYGATGSANFYFDGSFTSGTATLGSASASFTSGMVGDLICVAGAASGGGQMCGTISSFSSSTSVGISFTPTASSSGATGQFTFGKNDTTAFQTMLTTAPCSTKGCIISLAAKGYALNGSLSVPLRIPVVVQGAGAGLPNTVNDSSSPVNSNAGSRLIYLTKSLSGAALILNDVTSHTSDNAQDAFYNFSIICGAGIAMDGCGADGVDIIGWQGAYFENVYETNATAKGWYMDGPGYVQMIDLNHIYSTHNGAAGVQFGATASSTGNLETMTLQGSTIEANGGPGVWLASPVGDLQAPGLFHNVIQWNNVSAPGTEMLISSNPVGCQVYNNYFEVAAKFGSQSTAYINASGTQQGCDFNDNTLGATAINGLQVWNNGTVFANGEIAASRLQNSSGTGIIDSSGNITGTTIAGTIVNITNPIVATAGLIGQWLCPNITSGSGHICYYQQGVNVSANYNLMTTAFGYVSSGSTNNWYGWEFAFGTVYNAQMFANVSTEFGETTPAAGPANGIAVGTTGQFQVSGAGLPTAPQYAGTVDTLSGATPAINAAHRDFTITLSANATATVSGIVTGTDLNVEICQPASGGPFTWTWPAAIHGGMTIGVTASDCSMQTFHSFNGSTLVAMSTGVINVVP